MKIRDYAKFVGFEIIGKLTRRPSWEYIKDISTGEEYHSGRRHYSDEAGNEYITGRGECCIVTADGSTII